MFAALLLPGGAIGDRYGRRRALVSGLIIFGAGSGLAMTASTATELIALRGVLGIGAALVMPATLSMITNAVPADQRTKAVSIWAGVAGGAAVIGLLASGTLLQIWSWQSVFGLNVVLATISLAGTLRFVPETADPTTPPLDLVGAALAFLGLVVPVFTVIEAPDAGWTGVRSVAGFVLALLLAGGFVRWELRQEQPMLDPRLFRRRQLSAGTTTVFVQFFAFYGFTFISLQYLQIVRGDSSILAAVSVLPMAGTMITMSRLAPALAARFGARWLCAAGLVLIAAAMFVLAELSTTSSYSVFAGGLVVLGLGMGAAMTPATSGITDSLPAAQQGVGSALNDLSRELGGALGDRRDRQHPRRDLPRRPQTARRPAGPRPVHRESTGPSCAIITRGRADARWSRRRTSTPRLRVRIALLCAGGVAILAAVAVAIALAPVAVNANESPVTLSGSPS